MSTKSTIYHGPNFHFYTEGFDDDHVFLSLWNTEFEVDNEEVMLAIPVEIWETIRGYQSMSFDDVNKSDDDLLREVEDAVEKRMYEYAKADGRRRAITAFAGSFVYGSADLPKQEQVTRGFEYRKREREHQQHVLKHIQELRTLNGE